MVGSRSTELARDTHTWGCHAWPGPQSPGEMQCIRWFRPGEGRGYGPWGCPEATGTGTATSPARSPLGEAGRRRAGGRDLKLFLTLPARQGRVFLSPPLQLQRGSAVARFARARARFPPRGTGTDLPGSRQSPEQHHVHPRPQGRHAGRGPETRGVTGLTPSCIMAQCPVPTPTRDQAPRNPPPSRCARSNPTLISPLL